MKASSVPNSIRIRHEGKSQIITSRSIGGMIGRTFTGGFMAVWLTGWSIGCGFLIYQLITDFQWFMLLFAIPFFVGWIFGASILLASIFGRYKIVLEDERLKDVQRVLFYSKSSEIPFKEITDIRYVSDDDSRKIVVYSTDKPIEFSTMGLSSKDARIFCKYLRLHTGCQPQAGKQVNPSAKEAEEALSVRKTRPENCNWNFAPNFGNETLLLNEGKFESSTFFVLLFLNLFWNSIVATFLLAPFFEFDNKQDILASTFGAILYFLFLTPFVLIGLAMLVILIFAALDPFRRTEFRFSDREIQKSTA